MLDTGFAVQVLSTACPPLSLSTSGLHNFQKLLPAFWFTWDEKTFSPFQGAVIQHPAWAWANWALSQAKLIIWESSRSVSLQIPTQNASGLGTAGEQICWVGIAGMNSVCQDPCAVCCKPFPRSPSQSDSQWPSPTDSPARSSWYQINVGPPTKCLTFWRRLVVPSGLSFPIVGTRGSWETSACLLCWPEGGAMWSVCSPFSYASNAVCHGLWGAQGCFSFSPTF